MKQRNTFNLYLARTAVMLSGARRVVLLLLLTLLTTATAWATKGTMAGDGSAQNPFIIADAADWAAFASNVNAGTNADKYYKLGDSFDNSESAVTDMVGTSDHPFSGTFLGNGKTIIANITDTDHEGTALFRYISGATIKNLTVAGSISGGSRCAALVGFAADASTNLIENVTITAAITTNKKANTVSGILAYGTTSATTLSGCVFAGSISNGRVGSLWGWGVSGCNPTIINCLEKGSYSGDILYDKPCPVGYISTWGTVTNTYYLTDPLIDGSSNRICTRGTRVYTTAPDGLAKIVTAADGLQYYIQAYVSGMKDFYLYDATNPATISYTVKAEEDVTLTENTDYTVSVENSAHQPVSLTDAVRTLGSYTITFTTKAGSAYSGSLTMAFRVGKPLEGEGTESNPYKIGSAADWDQFTYILNGENGMTQNQAAWAVMTDDVPNAQERANGITGVTTYANNGCNYSGTFNGAGHKLTVSYGSAENRVGSIAPFICIEGGTIKFLHVDGHIFTNHSAAGIICFGIDSNLISCRSSVSIDANLNGEEGIGGIAYWGWITSNSVYNTISNCLFDGELKGTNNASCFVFKRTNNLKIENCLAAPQNIAIGEKKFSTFVSDDNTFNPTNSYYKLNGSGWTYQAGNLQGTEVTTDADALAELLGSSWMVDQSGNVVPVTDPHNLISVHVSLPKFFTWTGEVIPLSYTVTDSEQNTLTKGTHFTATVTKDGQAVSEVKDEGDYVLTLTAIDGSGYTGSKNVSFNVGDGLAKDSEGNYYVEMLNKETKEISPRGRPDGFEFTIRSARYPNPYYSHCDDKLILNTPGYTMTINGTHYSGAGSNVACVDQYFEFYDGSWESESTPAYTSSNSFTDHFDIPSFTPQNDKVQIRFINKNTIAAGGTYLLTVKLTAIPYDITYVMNGGTAGEGHFTAYTTGKDHTLVAATREGYVFAGWYDNESLTGDAITTIARYSLGAKTFYARWKKALTNTDITISNPADQNYTGSAFTPAVTVKDGETDITDQYDFTYSDNTNAGTATVTITAKASSEIYGGEATKTFKINPKSLTHKDVTISNPDNQTYTGSAFTPSVTVKDGETDIADQCDFTYSDNTNAGTATVTVTAKTAGNYSGEIKTTFNIVAKTVSTPTITLSATEYVYDGQAKEPAVSSVKVGDTVIPASEYTVAYENNTKAGTATVKIVDKDGGNYTVSGSTTFEIVLKGDANRDKKINAADIVKLVKDNAPQSDIDEVVKIIMQNK